MRSCIAPALAVLSTCLLSACAKGPDAIAPVSMGNAFASVPCRDAATMLASERSQLAALSAAQRSAVTGDALGVFLIGVPMSSLSGADRSGDIAATKGKVIALENRVATGCRG